MLKNIDRPQAWTEYHAALTRAYSGIEPVTPALMAAICPHLAPEAAVAGFVDGTPGLGHAIACPPLRVRGAYQLVTYIAPRKEQPARLHVHTPGRTPASYATEPRRGSVFLNYPHMEAAIAFAERHWAGSLTFDDWSTYVTDFLLDPSELLRLPGDAHDGRPRTAGTLYLALTRSTEDIGRAAEMPVSAGYDDALTEGTMDPLVGKELCGVHVIWNRFHCALCGSGLAPGRCEACDLAFRDSVARRRTHEPLGPELVRIAEAGGIVFRTDPTRAQAVERAAWEQGR